MPDDNKNIKHLLLKIQGQLNFFILPLEKLAKENEDEEIIKLYNHFVELQKRLTTLGRSSYIHQDHNTIHDITNYSSSLHTIVSIFEKLEYPSTIANPHPKEMKLTDADAKTLDFHLNRLKTTAYHIAHKKSIFGKALCLGAGLVTGLVSFVLGTLACIPLGLASVKREYDYRRELGFNSYIDAVIDAPFAIIGAPFCAGICGGAEGATDMSHAIAKLSFFNTTKIKNLTDEITSKDTIKILGNLDYNPVKNGMKKT